VTILDYEIDVMRSDERNMVLKDWMLNTRHDRKDIERCMRDGVVLVARARNGIALGWLAHVGRKACAAYVKGAYRDLGVLRALWDRAGRPSEVMHPSTARAHQVMRGLMSSREETR